MSESSKDEEYIFATNIIKFVFIKPQSITNIIINEVISFILVKGKLQTDFLFKRIMEVLDLAKIENISKRDLYKEALEQFSKNEFILDLGGGHPYSSVDEYKEMFRTSDKYYCLDIDSECRPHLIGDILTLPFKSKSVENIICVSVLEHIPEPQKAVNEIYRILKPGGTVLLVIPFIFPYHSIDHDYYRFTKDGIGYLFRSFSEVQIQPRGDYVDVALRFMAGFTNTGTKILLSIKPIILAVAKLYMRLAKKRKVSLHGHEQSVLFYNVICVK